jgi:hypothetical protein
MGVVGHDDVRQQPLRKKQGAIHALPRGVGKQTVLGRAQQRVLLGVVERVERNPVATVGFPVNRGQSAPPRLACRRQPMIAIAVPVILEQFCVDHRCNLHRRPGFRLRHDAATHRFERPPLRFREEARLARQRQPPVYNAPGLLVPGWRMPFGKHIVAGVAVAHEVSSSISPSAASPAIASAVKAGGAGSGGPFNRF